MQKERERDHKVKLVCDALTAYGHLSDGRHVPIISPVLRSSVSTTPVALPTATQPPVQARNLMAPVEEEKESN